VSCSSSVREAKTVVAGQKTSPNSQSSSPNGASDLYTFTNELGAQINLADFKGQALALTFIFTRCPMPQYCPRLSKNFAEASRKLSAVPNVRPNWHFFSITIDPEFDTPTTLKRYAEQYNYDPAHWSFLTGPLDRIQHLGKQFGMAFDPDGNLLKHTFRTVIIDPSYTVQQIIPVAGDFSEELVQQVLKAMASSPANEQK
jgi:protein SCO1/2